MLVRLQDVGKTYGAHTILDGASFEVSLGDRCGLVGINGSGKTTVLRLMAGLENADRGAVERSRGARIGYLPQEVDIQSDLTVMDEALGALSRMSDMERKLVAMEADLGSVEGEALEKLLEEYGQLRDTFEREGGYTYRAKAESVLQGLGLPKEHWSRPATQLSGGQKSRLMLARLLLSEPDALLLDEPTNHLDIQAIEWLEGFLADYGKAYLVVSHDRYFLDRTVSRMALLERARIQTYSGNYTKFKALREADVERQWKEYDRQEDLVEKTKDFIRRNIAGQKTKQAKSRIKMLDKMDTVERPMEEKTRAIFRFKEEERSGEKVLWAEELAAGYPGHPSVLRDVTISWKRRDRVGLVGPNGSGKTTLLKTLAGRLPPHAGSIGHGAKVSLGYFDQEQSDLSDDKTVLDTIWELMRLAPEVEVRSFLGLFDFSEDRVFVKVGALSGGERGRLQLARIVKQSPNLLLLDEPTNHLDLHTREALEGALADFTGTLLVVSHDRYFLDRVTNVIVAIEPGPRGPVLEQFHGNFTDYHHALEGRGDAAPEPDPDALGKPRPRAAAAPPAPAKEEPLPRSTRPPRPKKEKPVERRSVAEIEEEIFDLESELRAVGDDLAAASISAGPKVVELKGRYEQLQSQLETLYEEWDTVSS